MLALAQEEKRKWPELFQESHWLHLLHEGLRRADSVDSVTAKVEDRPMAKQYQPTDVRRVQIAEAALELIAEQGLDGFTTRAIASKVGITDGTIFRHFANKAEIVLAALDVLEERMFSVMPDCPDPLERLAQMFRHRAKFVAGEGLFGRLVFSEQLIHAAGEAARAKVQSWQRRNFAFITQALSELAAAGRLRVDRKPKQLLPIVQGMVLTFAFERVVHGPLAPSQLRARIKERWDTFCALMIKGTK